MAVTISGTDGIVGAGFTVDASGVSVTAGVGTFSSLNAAASGLTGTLPAISGANLTNLPAANLTGTLPALSAASLTSIPAANLVGVCTSGLANASGAFGSITRTTEGGALSGSTNYDFTLPANCFRVDFVGHNISTSGSGTPSFRMGTSAGILASGHYSFGKSGTGNDYYSGRNQIDGFDTNLNAASDTGDMFMTFLSSSASNMWIFHGMANRRTQSGNMFIIGVPDLGGNALTTIRFYPQGTGFDSGRFSYTAYSIS